MTTGKMKMTPRDCPFYPEAKARGEVMKMLDLLRLAIANDFGPQGREDVLHAIDDLLDAYTNYDTITTKAGR